MRLDLRHWEMLVAIDEAGTLRAASQRLGITQSALSHRLAEAERRLGGLLFEREGRRLRPAPGGRALTQAARQLLPALERAEADFQRQSSDAVHVVRFGIAAYSCYFWLPSFLGWAMQRLPRVQVDVVAAATQHPTRSLLEGDADLIVAPGHLASPGIEAVPLFDDELVLVVPPGHALANKPHIEAEDLADQDYMTYSRTTQPGFEYERFIRPSGVTPRLLTSVEMTDAIVELIATGFGVSILAHWAIRPALEAGRVAAVRVGRDGLDLTWSALLRDSDLKGSPARRVADLLAEWCGAAGSPTAA